MSFRFMGSYMGTEKDKGRKLEFKKEINDWTIDWMEYNEAIKLKQ